eukprot:3231277-Karenia_brevis.AAC.1
MLGLPTSAATGTWPATFSRISAVSCYVHARRKLVSLDTAPRRLCVHFAYKVSMPVLCWGAESWSLTAWQRDRLDAAQRRLLRGAARLPRLVNEGPRQYMHRANSFVADLFDDAALPFMSW